MSVNSRAAQKHMFTILSTSTKWSETLFSLPLQAIYAISITLLKLLHSLYPRAICNSLANQNSCPCLTVILRITFLLLSRLIIIVIVLYLKTIITFRIASVYSVLQTDSPGFIRVHFPAVWYFMIFFTGFR